MPNVKVQPQITRLSTEKNGTVHFNDGTTVSDVDKILFATGFHLSYPFIQPNPVVNDRLTGFYQHIFQISDPSLAVVGQVKAALSLRVYEYQAVTVARYFAGHVDLPTLHEQKTWEETRIAQKGSGSSFHRIDPDAKEYFNTLRDIAGKPIKDSDGYELPLFKDTWAEEGIVVLELKDKLARRIQLAYGSPTAKAVDSILKV